MDSTDGELIKGYYDQITYLKTSTSGSGHGDLFGTEFSSSELALSFTSFSSLNTLENEYFFWRLHVFQEDRLMSVLIKPDDF